MGEVRDTAPLGPSLLIALASHALYGVVIAFLATPAVFIRPGGFAVGLKSLFTSATWILVLAVIFTPVTLLVANVFDRRASFKLAVQQEYAALASALLYAWAAAHVAAIPLALIANLSGFQASYVADSIKAAPALLETLTKLFNLTADVQAQLARDLGQPAFHAANLFRSMMLPLLAAAMLLAVREVFRCSWARTIVISIASWIMMAPALVVSAQILAVLGPFLSSPLVLLMLFFLLRGYVGELSRSQRARVAFRQNLEAATLNPADASAHYNLGLIHLQRRQLGEARRRFQRAVEIDPDEIDAHYQLGRIARAENRWADAIGHFEQVVSRDPAHAQHEVWREIGATYIAAGQFQDAYEALSQFLDHRQLDPEGLYLMGRAQAGLGHEREAASSMRACIEAVRTAPAYKYRTEKRWLNLAQQFIKSSHWKLTD